MHVFKVLLLRSFYRHHYDVILDQEIPYNAILSSSGLFKGC